METPYAQIAGKYKLDDMRDCLNRACSGQSPTLGELQEIRRFVEEIMLVPAYLEKLRHLQRAARLCTRKRGHMLGDWELLDRHGYGLGARATCQRCGKEIEIKTHTWANEIEIAGEACALGCAD